MDNVYGAQVGLNEMQGLQAIHLAATENVSKIFGNAKLMPSPGFFATHATKIAKGMNEIVSEIARAIPAALGGLLEDVWGFIRDLLLGILEDIDLVWEFIGLIGEEIISNAVAVIAEAISYLGVAKNGAKTIYSLVGAAKNCKSRAVVMWNEGAFNATSADAAIKALKTIIDRELVSNTIDAARSGAATGVGIAGIVGDAAAWGAPVVSTAVSAGVAVVNAIVGLAKSLTFAGLEFLDMVRGNRFLADPKSITPHTFAKCPILGCYYLVLADTSDMANLCLPNIFLPTWKDEVEKLAKKMDKVRKEAQKAITKSRFVLIDLGGDVPMPKKTRVDYRTAAQKLRENIEARKLRPFMGSNVSGDAHRDLNMLKGKIIFEAKKGIDPLKVLAGTKAENFKNKVKALLPGK